MADPAKTSNPSVDAEDAKKNGKKYMDQLTNLLDGDDNLGKIMKAFFGYGAAQPPDSNTQIAQMAFSNILKNSASVSTDVLQNSKPASLTLPDGTTITGKLQQYNGTNESLTGSLKHNLIEMFNEGRLTFCNDKTKTPEERDVINREEMGKLLAAVPKIVEDASAKSGGAFDHRKIVERISEIAADKNAQIGINMAPDHPKLSQREPKKDGGVGYGNAVELSKGDLKLLPFRDNSDMLDGAQVKALSMDGSGNFTELKNVSVHNMASLLGDKFTIERVTEPVTDLFGGKEKTATKGYFLSDDKGKGFYLGAKAIDMEALQVKSQTDPKAKALLDGIKADAAPEIKPPAPAPDYDLAMDSNYQPQRGGPVFGAMT